MAHNERVSGWSRGDSCKRLSDCLTPGWRELSLMPKDEGMRSDNITDAISSRMQAGTVEGCYRSHFSLLLL